MLVEPPEPELERRVRFAEKIQDVSELLHLIDLVESGRAH